MKIKLLMTCLLPAYMLFGCDNKELYEAVKNSDLYTFNTILNAEKVVLTQQEKSELLGFAQEIVARRKNQATSITNALVNRHTLFGAGLLYTAFVCKTMLSSNWVENNLRERLQRVRGHLKPHQEGDHYIFDIEGGDMRKGAFTPQRYVDFTEEQALQDFSNFKKNLGFVPWLFAGIGLYHLYKGVIDTNAKKQYNNACAIKMVIENYPI